MTTTAIVILILIVWALLSTLIALFLGNAIYIATKDDMPNHPPVPDDASSLFPDDEPDDPDN